MLDYPALRAVAAVVQTGSFDRAARQLGVTPSAVSQRVKQLEERLGVVLIARGSPCTATETGDWLCRHMETVGMLEGELLAHLPALIDPGAAGQKVTLHIATNADSLGTWFLAAMSAFARHSPYLLNIAVDDQDHTADWLRRGRVIAAVTSVEEPIAGCRRTSLGALRYLATASPGFIARHFAGGVTPQAILEAPALTFNQKDGCRTGGCGSSSASISAIPPIGCPRRRASSRPACPAWGGG
ncbi:ArgP family transcriptional regulator [Ancylobacter sp. 3268]|nr:ArgP family transcriptional regulator [Ancylobacter sp. 3268]